MEPEIPESVAVYEVLLLDFEALHPDLLENPGGRMLFDENAGQDGLFLGVQDFLDELYKDLWPLHEAVCLLSGYPLKILDHIDLQRHDVPLKPHPPNPAFDYQPRVRLRKAVAAIRRQRLAGTLVNGVRHVRPGDIIDWWKRAGHPLPKALETAMAELGEARRAAEAGVGAAAPAGCSDNGGESPAMKHYPKQSAYERVNEIQMERGERQTPVATLRHRAQRHVWPGNRTGEHHEPKSYTEADCIKLADNMRDNPRLRRGRHARR